MTMMAVTVMVAVQLVAVLTVKIVPMISPLMAVNAVIQPGMSLESTVLI